MTRTCLLCHADLSVPEAAGRPVTGGICGSCGRLMTRSGERFAPRSLVETIQPPTLLMQADPRVIFMANARALQLFGKERTQAEGRRGGELFDCVNAFTEQGCGKHPGCDDCRIKAAVVDALEAGGSARNVFNPLEIRKGDETRTYEMEVSAERVGDLALLRIDRYEPR